MQDLDKFKNEMNLSGKNVYVGQRYVPKIMGEWDNTKLYEPLSIVQYQGASYTSRQYVPVGIEITNEEYWAATGNYNAQVEQYRQDVVNLRNDTNDLNNEVVELNTQLAQNIKRTKSIFDIKTLGIVGDGSIDETEKLQEIVDYSRNENIKVVNYDKNLIINISKPIYFDGGEDIDFGYATINKTTNTKGDGTSISPNRMGTDGDYIIDDYTVDAHFIFRHKDYSFTNNLKTVNIHFGSTTENTHDFAIFAPRVSRWQIENITGTNNRFEKFIYSFSMWQIPKFNNIEYHGRGYLLEIANDGSNKGSSTSINANQLHSHSGKGILKLYAVAYSTFTNIFGTSNTDIPYIFNTCRGVTVNGAEIEYINNGKFAWVVNSTLTFNSPSALELKGIPNTFANLWNVESTSKVVINSGKFPDYSEGTAQHNIGLYVDYGSHVTLNQCKMPSNVGNSNTYVGELTQGSSITIIDDGGVTVRTAEGVGTKFNGRKIYNVVGSKPSSGKWNRGDIALFTSGTLTGYHSMGYLCTRSGEFGTEQKPSFSSLPNIQPANRQEVFGTQPPNDSALWWRKGDMVINTEPSTNGVFAWVCVTEGFANGQAKFNVLKLTAE